MTKASGRALRDRTSNQWYGHRWRRMRTVFLQANPLCAYCERKGLVTASSVVDHVVPHRFDPDLFWDESNWQALCKPCHDTVKAAEEAGRMVKGVDSDGVPIDASHHWNR